MITDSEVYLNTTSGAHGSGGRLAPVKAHAALMLAAWTLFGAAALLSVAPSRHLFLERELFGQQVWFIVHRACNQVAWLLNVVAVAVMVGDRGFQPIKNLNSQGCFKFCLGRILQVSRLP